MARKGYKLASYKLPENLIESLKAEAEKRGTSQTALLVAGLRYVLGMESDIDLSAVEAVPGTDQRIDLKAVVTVPDIDQRIDLAIVPIVAQMEELKAEFEALNSKIANQPQYPQDLPSEDALESLPIKTPIHSDVKQRQPATGKTAPKNYGVLPPEAYKGLSQTALCNFYGVSWGNLKRNSASAGFDTVEKYLQQKTGIAWGNGGTRGMEKIYFPVAE